MGWIALKKCKGAQIPLVISGDTHHYSRYTGDDGVTQFITSGGGGAFLSHSSLGGHGRFGQGERRVFLAWRAGEEACFGDRSESPQRPTAGKSLDIPRVKIAFRCSSAISNLLLTSGFCVGAWCCLLATRPCDSSPLVGRALHRTSNVLLGFWAYTNNKRAEVQRSPLFLLRTPLCIAPR